MIGVCSTKQTLLDNHGVVLMKKYELYLFDFDLTLANSEKAILSCFRHIFETHGYSGITDEQIGATIGMMLIDALALLTGEKDADLIESYRQEYVRYADKVMTELTVFFPETIEVLRALKANGAKVGIVSSKLAYRIQESIDKFDINDCIDILLGGGDVVNAKPAPDGILKAMETFNISKENTLYVGDHSYDAMAAQNAGVDYAGVLHGKTKREVLEAYPNVAVMDSLSELLL